VDAEPRRHPLHGDVQQKPMDLGFIALLFLVAAAAWRCGWAAARRRWHCCCACTWAR
jgi:hypothetical protein